MRIICHRKVLPTDNGARMSCRCEQCGWPVHTDHAVTLECRRCKATIECSGDPMPEPAITPQNPKTWPAWARAVKKFARSKDIGVGDTVQRIAALFGGEYLKSFAATIGMPCGCTERQSEWNTRYPYTQSQQDRADTLVQHVITWDDWTRDTLALAQIILQNHPDVSGIAGVPRSGMRAACDVAIRLGVPLYEASHEGLRSMSGGGRIRNVAIHGERVSHSGPVVLVDDSTCSGLALAEIRKHPDIASMPTYVVYAASPGINSVAGYARHWELPHWFAWNWTNNGQILRDGNTGIDFDGVLCGDCLPEDDDDGPRYRQWLETVQPIAFPRDFKVPFIITARREAYREITEDWLARYRMQYGKLVMFPGTFAERSQTCIGSWKAEQCERLGVGLFFESSYHQACVIAQRRQRLTISIEPAPQ